MCYDTLININDPIKVIYGVFECEQLSFYVKKRRERCTKHQLQRSTEEGK